MNELPTNWKTAAASVTGTAHTQTSAPCQDAFRRKVVRDGANFNEVLILTAADGAGSASHSAEGAHLACESFTNEAEKIISKSGLKNLDREFVVFWLKHFKNLLLERIRKINEESFTAANKEDFAASAAFSSNGQISETGGAMKAENSATALNLREFASTFLAVIVGQNEAVFVQLGDGAIVYAADSAPDQFKFGIKPENADYANITHFLTDQHAEQLIEFQRIENRIMETAIFTDGIQNLAIDFRLYEPHKPFFAPMFAPLRSTSTDGSLDDKLKSFLDSPTVNQRTDDDKTLLLASRRV